MSEHPNITVINRMTQAVFENDRDTLAELFTGDMSFHIRGVMPNPGDYTGVDGFLGALGTLFELTNGDIKLEQLFCVADGEWAAEWEQALMGRKGRTLEMKDLFVYRFEGGRISEIWMLSAAPPDAESFWG